MFPPIIIPKEIRVHRQFAIGLDVTVRKEQLKTIVSVNRNQHRALFEKAVKKYRTEATKRLNSLVDQIAAGGIVQLYVGLPVPEEHTDDYDRALRMLDLHVGEEITLTEEAHRCLVDDEWGWSAAFATNTVAYTSGRPLS